MTLVFSALLLRKKSVGNVDWSLQKSLTKQEKEHWKWMHSIAKVAKMMLIFLKFKKYIFYLIF